MELEFSLFRHSKPGSGSVYCSKLLPMFPGSFSYKIGWSFLCWYIFASTMKVCAVNCRRGLSKKRLEIECLAAEENLSILALSETDLSSHETPPILDGYECISGSDTSTARICVYIKDSISLSVTKYPGVLPVIVINTFESTWAFLYGEFTENAYTVDKIRLSEKERTNRIIDFLLWLSQHSKPLVYCMGDFNIDVSSNSISKIRLDNWCKDFNFKQLVKSPTRDAVNCKGHPTSSCINLFITRSNKKMNIAFKDCTFSDHKAVFLQIGRFNHKKERIQVRRSRRLRLCMFH